MCFVAHCVPFWFFLGSNSPIFIIFIPRFRHRAQSSKWNPSDSSWNRGSFPRCCPHCAMGHHGTPGWPRTLSGCAPQCGCCTAAQLFQAGADAGGTWWDFWQAQKKDFAKKNGCLIIEHWVLRRETLRFLCKRRGTCIWLYMYIVPSGKRLHNYGKSPFLMGKLTINCHFQ